MVSGEIGLTRDVWQASNVDGYFDVTGHWIEERAPGRWKLEHALRVHTHEYGAQWRSFGSSTVQDL
jgi:hypothetical protein